MLLLLTLKSPSSVWNLKKKCRFFYCTGLIPNSKLVHLDAQNFALFTQNLVQKRMRLFMASTTHWKWLKKCNNQTMPEKRKYMYFPVYGLKYWSQICKNTQNKLFSSLPDAWLRSISKWCPSNVISLVILLLLTHRTCSLL